MLGDGAGTEEAIVSRFTANMFRNARESTRGMVTGEPFEPLPGNLPGEEAPTEYECPGDERRDRLDWVRVQWPEL